MSLLVFPINEGSMKVLFDELKAYVENQKASSWIGDAKWFKNDYIEIYVRVLKNDWVTNFVCDGFLVIANVGVNDRYRRRGVFTQVLKYLENINPFQMIGVESVSVSSIELRQCLIKEGFVPVPEAHLDKHFYKNNLNRI